MNQPNHSLNRSLNLFDSTAIGLGAIVGAGIFVVTGVAAGLAGPAFIIGLVIAGIVATFNGLSSAQLAAAFPQSGGTYEYGYRLLHPYAGFAAGWMFLLSKLAAAGVVAIGFGSYVQMLLPALSPIWIGAFALVLLTIANLAGIKKAGILNALIIIITLLCLVYFIFSGIPKLSLANFEPFAPFGMYGIAEATALLFFAFTGYARIATLAEEVKNPQKTIPRAIMLTIFSAMILYVAVSFVCIGVMGANEMAFSTSPLLAASTYMSTPGIQTVIIAGASTAMLGVLLSQILGISRMMFAMSRRGDLPNLLQTVSEKRRVPVVAVLLTGFIILAMTILGSFTFILSTAAFAILLYYSITNLAAFRHQDAALIYHKFIPVLGLCGCLIMAFSLPWGTIFYGFSFLVAGFIFKFIRDRYF